MKRPWIIAAVIVVLALAAFGVATLSGRNSREDADIQTPGTVDEIPTDTNETPITPADREAIDSKDPDNPIKPAPNDDPTPSGVEVSITRTDSNGSVAALIEGAKSGTCTAEYRKTGQPIVTKTGPIEADATYYYCGVTLQSSQFPEGGDWKLTLVAKTPSGTGSAAKTVTIRK